MHRRGFLSTLHHAIIVTSWNHAKILEARTKAGRIFFGVAIPPVWESRINEYWTLLIPPDGSKEGWAESDAGDRYRVEFIAWLDEQRHEDGSSWFSWVEVQYGDDYDGDTKIVRHSEERVSVEVAP